MPEPPARELLVRDLPLSHWDDALEVQLSLLQARREATSPDCLLLTEHHPIVTLGRATEDAEAAHALRVGETLGIPVRHASRGGRALWHGPGQLVGYPIVALRPLGLSPLGFIQRLEEALTSALRLLGVAAQTRPGLRGVWVGDRKLGFIGIAVRGGITYHGFALNITAPLEVFDAFDACGLAGVQVTNLSAEVPGPVEWKSVRTVVVDALAQAFRPPTAGER